MSGECDASEDTRQTVGTALARLEGLSWILFFVLIGWGLFALVSLRQEPPAGLGVSLASDAAIEFYGSSEEIALTLVSRLDTRFDPGRMVLTVPIVDDGRDAGESGHLRVVVPSGARTILVDENGEVLVLALPLPPPVLRALARPGDTVAEKIEASRAARAALDSLPRVREFLTRR